MALRECPECRQPISTSATACPHCGCPLHNGKKKQSYLRPLLLTLALLSLFAAFYGREDAEHARQRAILQAGQEATPRPQCDADKALQLVQKAIDGGILHRLQGKPEVSRVYVLEPWSHLTIDEKKALDVILKCAATDAALNTQTIMVYHDGRTGKELATSSQYGFTMK